MKQVSYRLRDWWGRGGEREALGGSRLLHPIPWLLDMVVPLSMRPIAVEYAMRMRRGKREGSTNRYTFPSGFGRGWGTEDKMREERWPDNCHLPCREGSEGGERK
jgi:hypothetical protein